MQRFFESLESRSLFSVTPLSVVPPPRAEPAVIQPLVALKKMSGKWSGTVVVTNIQTQPVTITINKQKPNGRFTGLLVAVNDPTIRVAITGRIRSNRRASITLVGNHSGGAIDGSGTGKLSSNGKTITFTLVFIQNGQQFPGTLTLKRA